jgi:glycine/D-amino acid oxidase-like deaminating enzyme
LISLFFAGDCITTWHKLLFIANFTIPLFISYVKSDQSNCVDLIGPIFFLDFNSITRFNVFQTGMLLHSAKSWSFIRPISSDTVHHAALHSYKNCHVSVVGGGICGLSTAWFLQKHGFDVTLVERDRIGSAFQASAINPGLLQNASPAYLKSPDELLDCGSEFSMDAILCAGSIGIYEQLQTISGGSIDFRRCPTLSALMTEQQFYHFAARYPTVDRFENSPVSGAVLTRRQALVAEPALSPSIIGAIYHPHTAMVSALKTMMALRHEVLRSGVQIIEQFEVVDVRRDDSKFLVSARPFQIRSSTSAIGKELEQSASLMLRADKVVIAAGEMTPFLASRFPGVGESKNLCKVVSVMQQMFTTHPQLDSNRTFRLKNAIRTAEGQYFWSKNRTSPPRVTHEPIAETESTEQTIDDGGTRTLTSNVYVKQCPDGSFMVGGDRRVHPSQRTDSAVPTPRIMPVDITSCYDRIAEILPEFKTMSVSHQCSGVMTFSPDGPISYFLLSDAFK